MKLAETQILALFKQIQTESPPALWSQGVTLTRGEADFVMLKHDDHEIIINVKLPGKPLSPKVMLWPQDQDWDCDCGSDLPCQHIVASVIKLKQDGLKIETTDKLAERLLPHVAYHFVRNHEGLLTLERKITTPEASYPLKTTLLAYVAGVKSGRIDGPELMATKADFALDHVLRSYRGDPLDRPRIEAIFKNFDSEQKFFLDGNPVQISDSKLIAKYEIVDELDGYRLKKQINPLVVEVFSRGVALCTGNILRLLNPRLLNVEEAKLVDGEGSFWPANKEHVLFSEILPQLQKKIHIEVHSNHRPKNLELEPRIDLLFEKQISSQGFSELSVLANLVYGDPAILQLDPNTQQLKKTQAYTELHDKRAQIVVERNRNLEKSLLIKLSKDLNLQIGRRVTMRGYDAINFVRKCKDWSPHGDGVDAFCPELRLLEPQFDILEMGSDTKSFKTNVHFVCDQDSNNTLDASELRFEQVFRAWEQGLDYVPLLNGSWATIPKDWMSKHAKKVEELLASRDAQEIIPNFKIPQLEQICSDAEQPYPESLKNISRLLNDFESIPDTKLPQDLNATLRNYQRQGVGWLNFLRDSGLGAMLADDMGLGKTLQMLCAIQGKTLIIAPTSVIYNWKSEIHKFRPSLKVHMYYGPSRSLDRTADIILTSFGVLRMDLELLNVQEWDTIVLDEAQNIKNPDSQITRACHSLRAKFKASLSGTPVENKLDDLWSQLEFINPGFLGTRSEFLEKFARPIVQGDKNAATDLKKRIKPFILRRLKKDVAPELPPRTENILFCELDAQERVSYQALLAASKEEVIRTLEGGGNMIKALEVILRLRQACCDTRLLPGSNPKSNASSKIELLMNTLEESLSEGHKSLIFSQWTSFLDLIEEDLKKSKINYSRIDGSTKNRIDIVNRFQSPDGPPVMLISLKAGGVGLNLTAADHIFITDPWWNPSVEDQAADRAHRIGQTNPVIIHKLVAKDTIEERILELQNLKKELAKAVLDEGAGALSLTKEDLMRLVT